MSCPKKTNSSPCKKTSDAGAEKKSKSCKPPLNKETHYDVFLSYSHLDKKKYGEHMIEEIKKQIQEDLEDIARRPLVFLDTDALQVTDSWHSKIMEKINECKIFVCLLSENYLNSSYCTRERLAWARKEIQNGRLRRDTLPVYYIQIEPDPWKNESSKVQDLFGFQMEQPNGALIPWITAGQENAKLEFVQERIDNLKKNIKQKLKNRHISDNSFNTVYPKLSSFFVGRILDLKNVRDCCCEGYYPVLQGVGGVGKTELAIAYTYGYAEDYPQGRFLIHMEGKRSWRDALISMVKDSSTGGKVRAYLDISSEIIQQSEDALHAEIVRKLFDCAKSGQLLLLLDNIDDISLFTDKRLTEFSPSGEPIPQNLQMIATTREPLSCPERCKARVIEIGNLQLEEAFELFCVIGGDVFPFNKKADLGDDPESNALREIITLLKGHVLSMEIIAGYMAENYANGMTFVNKLQELRKSDFVINNGGHAYRNESKNSLELLQPTITKIQNLPLGDAILDLLKMAALMNPDAIYTDVLKNCWNEYYGNLEFKDGVPVIYALNTLKRYHLINGDDDKKKMHRLTHGAVRLLIRDDLAEYAKKLAPFLEKAHTFSQQDWCKAILTTPELYIYSSDAFKNYKFSTGNWVTLLCQKPDPDLEKYCPWEELSGRDWVDLLCFQPQFADKCPWEKLNGYAWCILLGKQPQFADKCPWNQLGGGAWASLLSEQPQFADKCQLEKLDGYDWAHILSEQPQFAGKCPWEKLSGTNWAVLLGKQPEFADKCPWEKLDGSDWAVLLRKQPQFADKCPWEKLDDSDWKKLLSEQPQFADKCPWEKLDGYDWAHILSEQPQFADKCPWEKLDGYAWCILLGKQPQFADKCPWNQLGVADRVKLLREQPQFADKCPWEKLDGYDWGALLCFQPQFADKCPWEKLDGHDWVALLCFQPQFADKCPWVKLRGTNWADLLGKQPQFADKCQLEKLDGYNWAHILSEQPQFADKCPWNQLGGTDWASLLREQPQFADKCPWTQLGGADWASLLRKQPQFADKCPWEKLDDYDWGALLCFQPQFADKYPWVKLDDSDWEKLLSEQPQFAKFRK